MKKSILLIISLAALLMAACQRETNLPENREDVKLVPCYVNTEPIKVNLSTEPLNGEPDTKSTISFDATEFKTAYLFAFKANDNPNYGAFYDENTNKPVAIKITEKTFQWNLPVGVPMDLFAIVNPDEDTQDTLDDFLITPASTKILKESDFTSLKYICTERVDFVKINETGMPMSGVSKNITLQNSSDVVSFTLKRLFARYDIRLNVKQLIEDENWTINGARILCSKSNKIVDYFYTGNGAGSKATSESELTVLDGANASDDVVLLTLDDNYTSVDPITVYVPENCQGDISGASKWSSVYRDLKDKVKYCSYLEIILSASKNGNNEELVFGLYPGSDPLMKSNFDVVRNSYKKVKLALSIDDIRSGISRFYKKDFEPHPGEIVQIPFLLKGCSQADISFEIVGSNIGSLSSIKPIQYNRPEKIYNETNGQQYFIEFATDIDAAYGSSAIIIMHGPDGQEDRATITLDTNSEISDQVKHAYDAEYATEWSAYLLDDLYADLDDNHKLDDKPVYYEIQAGHGILVSNEGHGIIDSWSPISREGKDYDKTDSKGTVDTMWGLNGVTNANVCHLFAPGTTNYLFVYGYPEANCLNRLTFKKPFRQKYDNSISYHIQHVFFESSKMPVIGLIFRDCMSKNETLFKPDGEKKRLSLYSSTGDKSYNLTPILLDPDTLEPIEKDNVVNGQAFGWVWAGNIKCPGGTDTAPYSMYPFSYSQLASEQKIKVTTNGSSGAFWGKININLPDYLPAGAADGPATKTPRHEKDYILLSTNSGTAAYNPDVFYMTIDYNRFEDEHDAIYHCGIVLCPEVLSSYTEEPMKVVQANETASVSNGFGDTFDISPYNKPAPSSFYLAEGLKQTYFVRNAKVTPTVTITSNNPSEYTTNDAHIKSKVTSMGSAPDVYYRVDIYCDGPAASPHNYSSSSSEGILRDECYQFSVSISDGETQKDMTCFVLRGRIEVAIVYDYETPSSPSDKQSQACLKIKMWNPFGVKLETTTDIIVQEILKGYNEVAILGNAPILLEYISQKSGAVYTSRIKRSNVHPSLYGSYIEGLYATGSFTDNRGNSFALESMVPSYTPTTVRGILDRASYSEKEHWRLWDISPVTSFFYTLIELVPVIGMPLLATDIDGWPSHFYTWSHPVPYHMTMNIDIQDGGKFTNFFNFFSSSIPGLCCPGGEFANRYLTWKDSSCPLIKYKWFGDKDIIGYGTFMSSTIVSQGVCLHENVENVDVSDAYGNPDPNNPYNCRFQHDYMLDFYNAGYSYGMDEFEMSDSPHKQLNFVISNIPKNATAINPYNN